MSHAPRLGRSISCSSRNKACSLQLMDAGSVGILNYVMLRIEYLWWCSYFLPRGHLCRCLPCTYIGLTEITGLCIATCATCDPASRWAWPFLKQADQGFATGLLVLKRVDRFRNVSAVGNRVVTYILYLYQHLSVTKVVVWAKSEAVVKLYKSTGIVFDAQVEILAVYRAMEASGAFRKERLAAWAGASQPIIIAGPGMLARWM